MSIPIKRMRAAILVEQKKPLLIDEVELPGELLVGQVLVKILYTGICGSQIGEIQGVKGEDKYLPHLLGHEASAEVIAIGAGVRLVKPGDLAILHWKKGAGIEAQAPQYSWRGKQLNAGAIATFSEYAIVSENRITPLREKVDLEAASLLGCAVTTGIGVITNNAKVKIGESVVVLGAGGVGLNEIEGAALAGAYPIVAVDLHDHKLEHAKLFGATHTINSRTTDLGSELSKIIGKGGADVVVENTGNTKLIEFAYSASRDQGRVVLVGVPKKGDNISIYSLQLHFGKTLTGSHGGDAQPNEDIPRYLKLIAAGKMRLKELVTERCTLETINQAIDRVREGVVIGRCVVGLSESNL